MNRVFRFDAALAMLACIATLVGGSGSGLLPPHTGPLEVSYWYWNHPFSLSKGDLMQMQRMGAHRLFIHAGTLAHTEDGIRRVLPQTYRTHQTLQAYLVYNFSYNIVRAYGATTNAAIDRALTVVIPGDVAAARAAGLTVEGIQLDFDCPTSHLPRYIQLLRIFRPRMAALGLKTSITALPTWMHSRHFVTLAASVDFLAPQFYEPSLPRNISDLTTISSVDRLESGMQQMGRIARPFYAGLPAYGHALVFGATGKVAGMYQDSTVYDAAASLLFVFKDAYPTDQRGQTATPATWSGEEFCRLAATDSVETRLRGFQVLFDLPTPDLIQRGASVVRGLARSNCLGMILFRFPGKGEADTIPLQAAALALNGNRAQPNVHVSLRMGSRPWEIIDTGDRIAVPQPEIRVDVENRGPAATFAGPGSVRLVLHFDHAGLDSAAVGSFDSIQAGNSPTTHGDGAQPLDASLGRANTLTCSRFRLGAGERAVIGPIIPSSGGSNTVWAEWAVRTPDGFGVVRGRSALTRFGGNRGT